MINRHTKRVSLHLFILWEWHPFWEIFSTYFLHVFAVERCKCIDICSLIQNFFLKKKKVSLKPICLHQITSHLSSPFYINSIQIQLNIEFPIWIYSTASVIIPRKLSQELNLQWGKSLLQNMYITQTIIKIISKRKQWITFLSLNLSDDSTHSKQIYPKNFLQPFTKPLTLPFMHES